MIKLYGQKPDKTGLPLETTLSKHWEAQSKISLYDIIYRAIDNNIPVYSVHTDSIVLPSKNIKTLNSLVNIQDTII